MRRVSRKAILRWLEDRFFLRVHMFWILTGTFLSGLLTTRILLGLQVDRLWLRWSIAVLLAYCAFLVLIRLWLWYVRLATRSDSPGDGIEPIADLFANLQGDAVAAGADAMNAGGGDFGGGGASGSWGEVVVIDDAAASSSSISDAADLGGCAGDEAAAVVVLVILVFAIVMAGLYTIWMAPAILGEAAFEAALAAALARSARRIDRPGWVGRVWRATIVPLIVILVFAILGGFLAQDACPDATRLRDVVECLLAGNSV